MWKKRARSQGDLRADVANWDWKKKTYRRALYGWIERLEGLYINYL